jgi:hypothetical protein
LQVATNCAILEYNPQGGYMQENAPGSVLRDARVYVQWWFTQNRVKAGYAKNVPLTFNTLYLDYEYFVRGARAAQEFVGKSLAKDPLLMAYHLYIDNTLKVERKEALKAFACTGADYDKLRIWVKAMTGKANELDLAVMQHWLWQVKRKSFGLPIKHHIMPILFGPQGSGKTLGISALIEPYSDFIMSIKMDHLEDSKNYQGMEDNLIIFFDELQKMQRTDMEVLKHQITGNTNTYRPLYTNHAITVKQNCSFIGATNKPYDESFNDTTGSRRFYEITTPNKCDWEIVNALDCKAIWLGIDESLEHGYLTGDKLTEIARVQGAMTKIDDVELYISERDLRPEFGDKLKPILNQTIYDDYSFWCSRQGLKAYDLPFFSKKLKNAGIPKTEERLSRKRVRYFMVSENCEAFNSSLKVEKV